MAIKMAEILFMLWVCEVYLSSRSGWSFRNFSQLWEPRFEAAFLPPPSPFYALVAQAVLSGLAVVKWWHKATAMPSVASSRLGGLIYREDAADDGCDLFLGGRNRAP